MPNLRASPHGRRTFLSTFALCLTFALLAVGFAQGTDISLSMAGGEHAGEYQAHSDTVTCSYGLAAEDAFGNQYSILDAGADEFSSLQLIVDGDAAAQGAAEFLVTIGFGTLMGGTSYTVDTHEGRGSGTVHLDDRGSTATVTIEAQTADGVSIDAVVECHEVMRFDGGGGDDAGAESEGAATQHVALRIGDASYELPATLDDGYCEPGLVEEGDLYFSYYPEVQTGDIYSLEIMVYDATASEGSDVYVSINDQEYYIDTSQGDGTGSATVRETAEGYVIEVNAELDGLPVVATVSCAVDE